MREKKQIKREIERDRKSDR